MPTNTGLPEYITLTILILFFGTMALTLLFRDNWDYVKPHFVRLKEHMAERHKETIFIIVTFTICCYIWGWWGIPIGLMVIKILQLGGGNWLT